FANPTTPRLLRAALRLLREQTNARCPERETSGECDWGRRELGRSVADFLSGPMFAGLVDVGDALQADDLARRELERFLVWALEGNEVPRVRDALLASLGDWLQLAPADSEWAPVAAASASLARTGDRGPGALERGLLVLDAMTGDAVDPHHALEAILPLLVTKTNGQDRAPLEVFVDAIADVNRYDSRETTPLGNVDHAFIVRTLREFLVSRTRGFPQLYAIVRERAR
ncbi:MAG: hypothetical protein FJ096_12365, partial [Deltaproteobacteria bacterium]|nr:hypothetical protein [Deltaproteobacteria bacterium]